MDVIKEILQNYWKEIISVVLFIASVVIALVRKKPVSDVISYIYEYCIEATKIAESTSKSLHNLNKKEYAIEIVKDRLKKVFPNIDSFKYTNLISAFIEDILETPQKKG